MKSGKRGHNPTPRWEGPHATLRTLLLGSKRVGPRPGYLIALGLGLFGLTFLAYEIGVFYHSGGVVFVPFHAAIVGMIAAFWVGYSRNGLLIGWIFAYLSFLGWHAEWATDISPRPLIERIYYVIRPDGLVALAIMALVVAVVGFTAGEISRKGINVLRDER